MSLYRTWRPKSFADLVGQDAVVRTLSSALESGKLAHAYLFSGPRGSGKTSAAKILARCINCVNGPTASPDNTCENCRAILAGTALDVLEIDAASNRGIDEIRALRDAVKFAPSTMRMKVYIIDEAHMLTKEGANAFLKTLEEPPAHAVFILATTEPEKLPVTILSRCQRYAFRRIAIPVMIERMREIAAAENLAIDEPALSAIAYRADGGLRDALTMLEQAAAFADGAITTQTIELAFGATGRKYANTLLDELIAKDAAGVLRTIDEASDAGTDMQVLLRGLIGEFRSLLVGRIDPQLLARDLAPEDAARASERGKLLTQVQIVRALRLLSEALATARSSGNPRLELETALLRYALASEDLTLDAMNARVSALEQGPAISAAPPSAPEPRAEAPPASRAEAPAAPRAEAQRVPHAQRETPPEPTRHGEPVEPQQQHGPVTIQKVKAAWNSVRTKVESERAPMRAPLSRATLSAIEGNALVLTLPDPVMAGVLKDNLSLLEQAIADVLNTPLRVTLKVEGAPARSKGGGAARTAASVQASEPPAAAIAEDPDELFSYLNERIR
ncbi:MAG TPA: DNA polymerase III subunit gamma/tau [Candidatus Baltobacteraceae bacterium]|nr:DNA polymerase III subunit gamma/tau [Candidatus Baltobacteraceae bacterium]